MLVLVELNVVEQRYQAVLEVLNQGASVTDVASHVGRACRQEVARIDASSERDSNRRRTISSRRRERSAEHRRTHADPALRGPAR